MKFTKMHGLGNDFIIIDNRSGFNLDYPGLARNLCRRHLSIGADGILVMLSSNKADIRMRIFNADGSEAEMCGNGIRCFARYIYEKKIFSKKSMSVETPAGIIKPQIVDNPEDPRDLLIRVDMGKPALRRNEIPMTGEDTPGVIDEKIEVDGDGFHISAVSMGNPHCIIFVDEITDRLIRHIGPLIEQHPVFPRKTNVEFARFIDPGHVKVRVWERGAGETLACGTGACAVVVAGIMKKMLDNKVKVSLPGGNLLIEWNETGHVYMTGPAVEVFCGELTQLQQLSG
ncbi:MAG: diaminopimelate epimerase [Candidatus Eremiobacteraeota bacterium]|nr:diaminopimelate epimerase [Candidatus Eremiobacteraeota bacterium]